MAAVPGASNAIIRRCAGFRQPVAGQAHSQKHEKGRKQRSCQSDAALLDAVMWRHQLGVCRAGCSRESGVLSQAVVSLPVACGVAVLKDLADGVSLGGCQAGRRPKRQAKTAAIRLWGGDEPLYSPVTGHFQQSRLPGSHRSDFSRISS